MSKLVYYRISILRLNLLRTCRKIHTILKYFLGKMKILRILQSQNIGPEEFRLLTEDAINLRILSTSGCTWMSDDLLKPLLISNPKLNDLDLSYTVKCSSKVFQVDKKALTCSHVFPNSQVV